MKKNIIILCIIFTFIIMSFFLYSCQRNGKESTVSTDNFSMSDVFSSSGKKEGESTVISENYFGLLCADDSGMLDDILTKEYDLYELELYFEKGKSNENSGFGREGSNLTFSEVNLQYPVEIVRNRGYSVYKVIQGGYFYVFWVRAFNPDTSQEVEPIAYFSTYLLSGQGEKSFDSLKVGISTAKDVKEIDNFFELSFVRSTGVYSYSFLNDDTLIEIKYRYQDELNDYDDLIVQNITAVPRKAAPSRFSSILSKDLP